MRRLEANLRFLRNWGLKNAVFVSYLWKIKKFKFYCCICRFPWLISEEQKNSQKTFIFSLSREFRVRDIKNPRIFAKWFTFCPFSWLISEKVKNVMQNRTFPEVYRWGIRTFLHKGLTFDLSQGFRVGRKNIQRIFADFRQNGIFMCSGVLERS